MGGTGAGLLNKKLNVSLFRSGPLCSCCRERIIAPPCTSNSIFRPRAFHSSCLPELNKAILASATNVLFWHQHCLSSLYPNDIPQPFPSRQFFEARHRRQRNIRRQAARFFDRFCKRTATSSHSDSPSNEIARRRSSESFSALAYIHQSIPKYIDAVAIRRLVDCNLISIMKDSMMEKRHFSGRTPE